MKEMGWSEQEFLDTSYERYLDISRIMSLEAKKRKQEKERQKRRSKH